MNVDKTEFMSFKKDWVIFSLNGKPLKLIDPFIYLGSNISSTKSNFIKRIGKVWTAMDGLSIIWKSVLSYEIEREFFRAIAVSIAPHGLQQNAGRNTQMGIMQECYMLF